MKLLPLSNDFVFKAIFARKPDLLLDLLNSFPEFSGERKNPEILLTEDFEIHILELPKLKKNIFELQSTFEEWMFLLKSVENLKEVELKTLERKNPKVKKVISELRVLSQDEKTRLLYEERLKANLDYNSGLQNAFTKGRAEGEQIGIQKGKTEGAIESLYLGIELALENKFNFKGLALLPKVKKNKDLTLLKKILEIVLKSKDLEEVKIFLSKKKV